MSVIAGIYGKTEPEYVGCVLNVWERNGYNDSDFYATCWDRESGKIVEVEYDTTRAGGGGYADIDATIDVLRQVYRYYKRLGRDHFDSVTNIENAKKVKKGDTVKVIRGRKVKKGTIATVFWVGTCYNPYSRINENRVGLEIDGKRQFINLDYVEVIDWETRLLKGKDRKKAIRNFAVNSMPKHYRRLFSPREWAIDELLGKNPGWKVF